MTAHIKCKGMTLLEILISISILTFMFIFISQIIRQNYRQNKKIKQDIQTSSSLSHTLDLIRQDLQGVSYLLDLNANLNLQFPMESAQNEENFLPAKDSGSQTSEPKKSQDEDDQDSSPNVFLSSHFTFEGEAQKMSFVSHSFSNSSLDSSSGQWINIQYSLRDCASGRETLSGSCLFRLVHQYWENKKEDVPEETMILLRNIKTLKFFYTDAEGFLENTWDEEWIPDFEPEFKEVSVYPQKIPFPYAIKMEVEKEGSSAGQIMIFFVSSPYLTTWNPYNKGFSGFLKWNPPTKPNQKKPQNQSKPDPSPSTQPPK